MTAIELRHVSFSARDGSVLLDDVNLSIPSGSTVAITGPSGSGKSLLLRILAGLEEPSEGEILFDDVDVTAWGPRKRDTAVVFQDHALHGSRDVYDNLAFASTLRRGYDKAALAARIDDVAGVLALRDLLDLTPEMLDDAQRQRVALGRALVRDAQIYLLDEPFAAQAERIRTNVRSVTSQWQKSAGRTTIITTGSVTEALTVADTVIVMHQGLIHQVGTARELYDAPRNMFVAAFLGSPPMNLLPAFPNGQQLVTPLATILLDDEVLARIGDRQVVVAGIRPEDCNNSTEPGAGVITDRVEFTNRVDDVEWRGSNQYAYLGFELDPAVTDLLDEVEDVLEFDLFQNFLVAELSASSTLRPGHAVRIVIPRQEVHIFDPETGENLTLNND